jgi:hypothetical protein
MMRSICLASICVVLAACSLRAADPPTSDSKQPARKDEPAEKFLPIIGSVPAVVAEVNADKGVLKLKVTYRELVPNPDVQADLVNQQADIIAKQQAILQSDDPIDRQQRMVELYQAVAQKGATALGLFDVKETQVDVECNLTKDVKVRIPHLPPLFDEEGRTAKYTPEEIKKAKGPDNLPGFVGQLDNLKGGQSVLVHMKRKLIPKPGDDKPPVRYILAKEKPYAAIIVIVKDVE